MERFETKILGNEPVELNNDNDFFNVMEKADLIKSFLSNYALSLTKSKMIALYGNWGSGKTSVLKYIEKKLNSKTVFFNTWEYEKDGNLLLSLFEAIFDEVMRKDKKAEELKTGLMKFIKSIIKSTSINVGNVSFNGKEALESIEKYEISKSLYGEMKLFKKDFIKLENMILGRRVQNKDDVLFVFIDDLDRCEPENVTEILSVVKLFFTLGKRIIFICGVDKKAVEIAINIKYNDVVKSSEYLEKIFDVSFNMPKKFSVEKALRASFGKYPEKEEDGTEIKNLLAKFLEDIDFVNPRHLKKVLNKYSILRFFNEKTSLVKDENNILHNLRLENKNKAYIIVFFFMIILYEFYPDEYNILMRYEEKIKKMQDYNYNYWNSNSKVKTNNDNSINGGLRNTFIKIDDENLNLLEKVEFSDEKKDLKLIETIHFFAPFPEEGFKYPVSYGSYINNFEKSKNKILVKFCNFLWNNYSKFNECNPVQINKVIKAIENYL